MFNQENSRKLLNTTLLHALLQVALIKFRFYTDIKQIWNDLFAFTWNHSQLDNRKENRTDILKKICKPHPFVVFHFPSSQKRGK